MKHTVVITKAPKRSGKEAIPDGALAGNGDLSVILGNCENGFRVYVAKCDLWQADEHDDARGGIKPLGYVDFPISKDLYSKYYVEQRMDEAEIYCKFGDDKKCVEVNIIVCATHNDIIFELKGEGKITPEFTVMNCGADENTQKEIQDTVIHTRIFDNKKLVFPSKVSAGIREFTSNKFVLSVATNFDNENYEDFVTTRLLTFDQNECEKAKAEHYAWWKKFYSKSSFELSDKQLELNWYASQYHLAICSRNKSFPPGIYGNFITLDYMPWHGDYHLNYNYEAPYYGACSSNHTQLTDNYSSPLEDFMQKGRDNAKKHLNCRGVYFPVGLAPKGMYSELCEDPDKFERMFLGQKSNASYAAIILVMRWNSTRDTQYAKEHIYPFLKAVGDFWEDYLKLENGRYVIYNDAIHEVPYYIPNFNPKRFKKHINAVNPILSLALVRMVFKTLIDISFELNIDCEKHEKWRHILDNISDYPTFYKKFKKVYRYTEKGISWWNGNGLCIQHIYPAGQIGLSSDSEALKIARNTFFTNDRWCDDNATNSIFPCAVRIGVKPKLIIEKLKLNYKKFQLPNFLMLHGGGCLENCSLTAATLNEMAMQSFEGIIRIFPNWDKSIDCHFKNLRADGAFLVSAECKNGKIGEIEIFSEIGRNLTLQNPYDRCVIAGKVYTDSVITISTNKGEKITVKQA